MIKLETPEAFAIDYLSILEVKADKDLNNRDKYQQFKNCYIQLAAEFGGIDRLQVILASQESNNLYDANLLMYDAVEKARYGKDGEINPKEWDILNMNRHKAKQELQKKFWGNELTETKT